MEMISAEEHAKLSSKSSNEQFKARAIAFILSKVGFAEIPASILAIVLLEIPVSLIHLG